jgi:hypothetical protein
MPIDWIFYLNMVVKRMNLWRVIDILHIECAYDTVFRYSNSLDNQMHWGEHVPNLPLKLKICTSAKPKIDSNLLLYKQINTSNLVVVLEKTIK